jgi:hypothetical protein
MRMARHTHTHTHTHTHRAMGHYPFNFGMNLSRSARAQLDALIRFFVFVSIIILQHITFCHYPQSFVSIIKFCFNHYPPTHKIRRMSLPPTHSLSLSLFLSLSPSLSLSLSHRRLNLKLRRMRPRPSTISSQVRVT